MANEYERFWEMLDKCPRISGLWNRETRALDVERLENELGGLSSGEAYMARFLAGVWLNKDDYGFNLIGAMHTLDNGNRQIIIDWLNEPFFP